LYIKEIEELVSGKGCPLANSSVGMDVREPTGTGNDITEMGVLLLFLATFSCSEET